MTDVNAPKIWNYFRRDDNIVPESFTSRAELIDFLETTFLNHYAMSKFGENAITKITAHAIGWQEERAEEDEPVPTREVLRERAEAEVRRKVYREREEPSVKRAIKKGVPVRRLRRARDEGKDIRRVVGGIASGQSRRAKAGLKYLMG